MINVLKINCGLLPRAHYACTDLSCITTELWEIGAFSQVDSAMILLMIK